MKNLAILFLFVILTSAAAAQQRLITIRLDTSVQKSLKGRLYVFSSRDTARGVQDPDPFNPTPTFIVDVQNWKGGETIRITDESKAFPVTLNQIPAGYYKFAAVLDIDTLERNNTVTPGNYYSKDVQILVKQGEGFDIDLNLNKVIPQRPFKETDQVKLIQLKSELVSGFRKKDAFIKASVILPKSYQQNPSANYPVVFVIPGWGGTHYDVYNPSIAKRYGFGIGKEKIFVYLNPETSNPFGLHAFIDSRTTGPWGRALVEELIPLIKRTFRTSNQLFMAGQSSGGYAALWLQLHYPDTFTASWAVSPDPVDFSDFTGVNIYEKKANMYVDAEGKERGMFLMKGEFIGTIKRYALFEDFLGDGGQMQSFEAAFGLLDQNTRKPRQLYDRNTGIINPQVAKSWKPYDLSLFLEKNYKKLSSRIADKIFLYAGSEDNFLLNRPVALFKQKAAKLNVKATVELIAGANHWTIWSEDFTKKMHQEMDARIP